jgi:16S rRNA (guanine527-N7)-methyltransferase
LATSDGAGVGCLLSATAIEQAVLGAGLAPLTPKAIEQFEAYLTLLLKWNARLNLTAIREPEEIIRRHFVECIQCAQILPECATGITLLDFGSGAGLPGIPIAICRPEIQVTLAESQRKKAAFLRETVRSLGLKAEVYGGRVEDMPEDRRFSIVTLRAVDKMTEACRAAYARVAIDGWIAPFATWSTVGKITGVLQGVEWTKELSIIGSDQAVLLFGRRPH